MIVPIHGRVVQVARSTAGSWEALGSAKRKPGSLKASDKTPTTTFTSHLQLIWGGQEDGFMFRPLDATAHGQKYLVGCEIFDMANNGVRKGVKAGG